MGNSMTSMSSILTNDQCWNMYEEMLNFDINYHYDEAGYSKDQIKALGNAYYAHLLCLSSPLSFYQNLTLDDNVLFDKDAAFDQMDKDLIAIKESNFKYNPLTEDEADLYFSFHHLIGKNTIPEWKISSDKISSLLDQNLSI